MKKPSVVFLRGDNLCKWEMQNYEPLQNAFDLCAVVPSLNKKLIDGISFPVIPVKKDLFGGRDDYEKNIAKTVRSADIIHCAELSNVYSLEAIRLKKKGQARWVVNSVWQNIPFSHFFNARYDKAIRQTILDETDLFLAVTQRAKQALLLEGADAEKIVVQGMGVDLSVFKPRARETLQAVLPNVPRDKVIVLSAGRMVWAKGFHQILFAVKALSEDERDKIHLVFIGDGEFLPIIRSLVDALGLGGHVTQVPHIPYAEMALVHALADIFILMSDNLPSWQEQYGMVLVEAMASKSCVVTTTSGSIPEVVGEDAFLVPAGDFLSLKERLERLLQSRELIEAYQRKALERARRLFDAGKVSEKIGKMYQGLLSHNP